MKHRCDRCDGSGTVALMDVVLDKATETGWLKKLGWVTDAGGGCIDVLVDRDLDYYPPRHEPVYRRTEPQEGTSRD